MPSVTWYLTPITRASSQTSSWTVNTAQTQEYLVFFGTQAEYDALSQGQKDQYDITIIDGAQTQNNPVDQVSATELRTALVASDAPNPSDNQGYLGTGQIDLDGDGTLEDSVAYSTGTNGIQSSLQAVLITLEPPTVTTISPTNEDGQGFKGGVGNFKPFFPGSLGQDPICFVMGTVIATPDGPRPVETLAAGDLVLTPDHRVIELRLILSAKVTANRLRHQPALRPVRISAGALGAGLPEADLLVSPQHRVLVRSKIAQRMFGTDEVLVAAKQLLQIDGIDIATDLQPVTYYHLIFDQHEIVLSNGAETESLYPGPLALQNLGRAARDEIYALFPDLRDADPGTIVAARALASGRQGRKLASRHQQNRKPLLC